MEAPNNALLLADAGERVHARYSPSALYRTASCPGWRRLADTVKHRAPRPPSEDAREGTLLHSRVQPGAKIEDLTDEQQAQVLQCRSLIQGLAPVLEQEYELRMVLTATDGFDIVTYGWADWVAVKADRVIVCDFKFGRDPAPAVIVNHQLAAYSAMAMQKYGKPMASAYILQPRVSREPQHFVFTEPAQILANIETIISTAENDPSLILTPSDDACRYCPAKLDCPAVRGLALQRAEPMPAQVLSDWIRKDPDHAYQTVKNIEKFVAAALKEMKRILLEEHRLGTLWIQTTKGRRGVKDMQAAFDKLSAYMTLPEFLAHCQVQVGKLETAFSKAFKEKNPGATLIAGERKFAELMAELVQRGEDEERLQK